MLLGGGGFKSMLEKAVKQHARGCKISGAYKDRFLIVDADRAQQVDWSIEKLKAEAAKHKFTVCIQNPNHEGLLLRMMPGMEREISDAALSETKLKTRCCQCWLIVFVSLTSQQNARKKESALNGHLAGV